MRFVVVVCCLLLTQLAFSQRDTIPYVVSKTIFNVNYGNNAISGDYYLNFQDTLCIGSDTIKLSCKQDSLSFYGIDSIKIHLSYVTDNDYEEFYNDWIYIIDSSSCNMQFIIVDTFFSSSINVGFELEYWFADTTIMWYLSNNGDTLFHNMKKHYTNDYTTFTTSMAMLVYTARRSQCCVSSYENPPILSLQSNQLEICPNDSSIITAQGAFSHYIWNTGDSTRSIKVSSLGTYTCIASNGCVVDTASIIISASPCCSNLGNVQVVSICAEDSFYFNNQFLSQSGTYFDTLQTTQGCDSIVTLTLIVNPPLQSNISQTICSGNSYLLNGTQLMQGGIYKDTLQNAQGCDSIVTLTLTVTSPIETPISQTICSGSSYSFNGQNISTSGTYKDTLQTAQGCDSIITLSLTVNPPIEATISQTICSGSSYAFNGQNISTSGTYKDTLQTAQGCDSIVTLTLTVLPVTNNYISQTICEGDVFLFNGTPLSQSGIYVDTIQTQNACAVTTLALTVAPLPELVSAQNYFEIEVGDSVTLSACASGDFYEWLASTSSATGKSANNAVFSASPRVPIQNYTCIISNETGCADTCTYTVKVNGVYGHIYVPNAFSPNGDGINDVFQIFGKYIRLQNLTIFNRWGEIVFVSTPLNETWDGTFKGVAQASGIYTYELTYFSGIQNVAEHLKGSITLIR